MSKILVWYVLLLKMYIKKRSTWIQVCGMILLVGMVLSLHVPDAENRKAGFLVSKDAAAELLLKYLQEESEFTFVTYDSLEQLETDVKNGSIECGFWIEKHLEERLSQGNWKGCIHYISTPFTVKGEVMKESVYAAFFRVYSDKLLESRETLFFEDSSEKRRIRWLTRSHELWEEKQVFQAEYREVPTAYEKKVYRVYPLQGMVGLYLLLVLLLSQGKRFEPSGRAVEKAMTESERFWYTCDEILAAGTVSVLSGLLLVLCSPVSRGVLQEITAMALFLVWALLWVQMLGRLLRSMEGLMSVLLCVIAVNLLICPVFIDLSQYVPAIRYIKCISPLGLYLGVFD